MEFGDLNWPAAPGWALAVGSLGRGLVLFGLAMFLLSIVQWLFAPRWKNGANLGRISFTLGGIAVIASMVCLGALFIAQQFEFEYIRRSIQAGLDLKFRIAAIWAHQEGSFLLWAVTSSIFGIFAAPRTGELRRWFTVIFAGFLASLCGILAFESPFGLGELVHGKILIPPDGAGLTPSLQNYWVVIHPPTIFMGFGSLAVPFCWAMAALLANKREDWVKAARPWALASVAILGLGLCMGGFWAYETLGWGGFWAWDPVENVSFVPWILMAVFIHGIIVQTAGKGWHRANAIFGVVPFLAFVYGTFLTRSGVYADVSVHSFATMDRSALRILLGLLSVSVLFFLGTIVYRWKAWAPTPVSESEGIPRTSGYSAGMLLLCGIGLATAFGMSVPLIEFLQGKAPKIVEEPMYHQVIGWFFPAMLILMATAPFLSWRGTPFRKVAAEVSTAASLSFMVTGVAIYFMRHPVYGLGLTGEEKVAFPFGTSAPALVWLGFLLFLCIFVGFCNLARMLELRRSMKLSFGGFVSHIGVATLMAGMIISRGFERKDQAVLQFGDTARVLGYAVEFKGLSTRSLEDRDNKAEFFVQGPNSQFVARPGLYTFAQDGQQKWMTWPFIQHSFSHDIYFSLHEPVSDVWQQPLSIKPGETVRQDGIKVTYSKFVMHGQPGQAGTKFGAQLILETADGTWKAEPTLEMGSEGLVPSLTGVNKDLAVSLQGMNASDQSVVLQAHFTRPLLPIELFYKPMTSLVWLGAGILFLGGSMSAFYRRKALSPAAETRPAPSPTPRVDDAIVPAPQM